MKRIIFVSIITMVVVALFSACGNITKLESADLRKPITTGVGNTAGQNNITNAENTNGEKKTITKTDSATDITTAELVAKDSPVFNKVENLVAVRPADPPKDKKQEEWTFQQYKKHIGFDPITTVIPSVFIIDEIVKDTDTQTVYLEEDGTPVEGYHGCWRIYVENSSGAHMWMYISAAGAYKNDLLLSGEPEVWTINGATVTLAEHTAKDGSVWLAASFVLNNVGFYIETGDVPKTDFLKMVTSIIE